MSLTRRTPLKRKTPMKRGKPIRQSGKKTREWSKARKEDLKPAFLRAGITSCELRLVGCWGDNALGFAHSLKRRNIKTRADLLECALLCGPCHDVIEAMGEKKMSVIVREIIANRVAPVAFA